MATQLPAAVLSDTGYWLARFAADFHDDVPQQIHNREISPDGSPEWHPDFARWITARAVINTPRPENPTPELRLRTTRALRRLRKEAIREFEVVYRVMVLNESIDNAMAWLNDRAERHAIPLPPGRSTHYTRKDTIVLVVSGVDKMRSWW